MPLLPCEACGHQVSEQASACPNCGHPGPNAASGRYRGYEYKSTTTLLGLPLIHIATGVNRMTGAHRRVARGIIAIGDIAVGILAIGGISLGGIAIGGLSFGVAAFGGAAIGLALAAGGAAIGYVAMGGAAVGIYALGGGAIGEHVLSGMRQDAEAVAFFERLLGIRLPVPNRPNLP